MWRKGAVGDEGGVALEGAVARQRRRQTQERNAQNNGGAKARQAPTLPLRVFVLESRPCTASGVQLATSFCSTFRSQYGVRTRQASASATRTVRLPHKCTPSMVRFLMALLAACRGLERLEGMTSETS